MTNEEYDDISPEDSEYKFYKRLEELETQPKYMDVLLEDYLMNPTDNGAKILWLKYTKQGEAIPKIVMDRMVDVIEHEVLGFSSKLYSGSNMINPKYKILEFIHLAISKENGNLELFWNHLHNPENLGLLATLRFDKELIESAREAFPHRKKLTNTKLYEFAVDYLQIEDDGEGMDLTSNMKKAYSRFVKANKNK